MVLAKHGLLLLSILMGGSASRSAPTRYDHNATDELKGAMNVTEFDCEVVLSGIPRSLPALTQIGRKHKAFCRCPDNWFIDGRNSICRDAFLQSQWFFNANDFKGQDCFCRPKMGPPPEKCSPSATNFMGWITLGISYTPKGIKQKAPDVGDSFQAIYGQLGEEVAPSVRSELLKSFFNVYTGSENLRQAESGEGEGATSMLLMEIKICGLTDVDKLFQCPVSGDNPWIPPGTVLGISQGNFETLELSPTGKFKGGRERAEVSLPPLKYAQKVRHDFNSLVLKKLREDVTAQVMYDVEAKAGFSNVCVFPGRIFKDGVDGANDLFTSLLDVDTCPQAIGKPSFDDPKKYIDFLDSYTGTVCSDIQLT